MREIDVEGLVVISVLGVDGLWIPWWAPEAAERLQRGVMRVWSLQSMVRQGRYIVNVTYWLSYPSPRTDNVHSAELLLCYFEEFLKLCPLGHIRFLTHCPGRSGFVLLEDLLAFGPEMDVGQNDIALVLKKYLRECKVDALRSR